MIWTPEKREREVVHCQTHQKRVIESRIVDPWDEEKNQIVLDRTRLAQLFNQLAPWLEKARVAPMATSKGYQVDAAYGARIEGFTTQSHRVLFDDSSEFFALYNYPKGKLRRRSDRLTEALTGEKMRKPAPNNWKERVESRSVIPTVQMPADLGHPDQADLVVMPYIPSINGYDLFARPQEITDWGIFQDMQGLNWQQSMQLLQKVAVALAALHTNKQSWGEAILQNVVFTSERIPLWVDAEMAYRDMTWEREQATDVRNLAISSLGSFANRDRHGFDQDELLSTLLTVQSAVVLADLDRLCTEPMGWRQAQVFEQFGKYRLGAKNRAHFESCKVAIRGKLKELL